jgi:hypothetical protein
MTSNPLGAGAPLASYVLITTSRPLTAKRHSTTTVGGAIAFGCRQPCAAIRRTVGAGESDGNATVCVSTVPV